MIRDGTKTGQPCTASDPDGGSKQRVESSAFEQLKAKLAQAFAAPDSSYQSMTAADVIARNKA